MATPETGHDQAPKPPEIERYKKGRGTISFNPSEFETFQARTLRELEIARHISTALTAMRHVTELRPRSQNYAFALKQLEKWSAGKSLSKGIFYTGYSAHIHGGFSVPPSENPNIDCDVTLARLGAVIPLSEQAIIVGTARDAKNLYSGGSRIFAAAIDPNLAAQETDIYYSDEDFGFDPADEIVRTVSEHLSQQASPIS